MHAKPQGQLGIWLGVYASETPGVEFADNSTVRLDLDNEPQPDLALIRLPAKGGQTRVSADDYLEGAPEWVMEIVGSSRAYDLHQKKAVYRRNGVREYVAWITGEQRLLWWELSHGEYQELAAAPDGLLKSRVFPGLWLDPTALLGPCQILTVPAKKSASPPAYPVEAVNQRHGRRVTGKVNSKARGA